MDDKLKVIFEKDKFPISELEKSLRIFDKFPIDIYPDKEKNKSDYKKLIFNVKEPENRIVEIYPETGYVFYRGFEEIKDSNIGFKDDHVQVSAKTDKGRYNYNFYLTNPYRE